MNPSREEALFALAMEKPAEKLPAMENEAGRFRRLRQAVLVSRQDLALPRNSEQEVLRQRLGVLVPPELGISIPGGASAANPRLPETPPFFTFFQIV